MGTLRNNTTQMFGWSTLLGTALVMSAPALSHAALFTDNFNRPDSADINAPSTGQGGSLAPLTYTLQTQATAAISGNSLSLTGATQGTMRIDHNFVDSAITSGGGFIISFTANPVINPAENARKDDWLAVMIGRDANNALTHVYGGAYTILFRDNGSLQSFMGGSLDISSKTYAPGAIETSYQFELRVETSSFALGAPATVTLSVNGTEIDINGSAIGNVRTFNWITDNLNYISFEAFNSTSTIDNVSITAIPEPASLSLLTLAGGLLLARRRRA